DAAPNIGFKVVGVSIVVRSWCLAAVLCEVVPGQPQELGVRRVLMKVTCYLAHRLSSRDDVACYFLQPGQVLMPVAGMAADVPRIVAGFEPVSFLPRSISH